MSICGPWLIDWLILQPLIHAIHFTSFLAVLKLIHYSLLVVAVATYWQLCINACVVRSTPTTIIESLPAWFRAFTLFLCMFSFVLLFIVPALIQYSLPIVVARHWQAVSTPVMRSISGITTEPPTCVISPKLPQANQLPTHVTSSVPTMLTETPFSSTAHQNPITYLQTTGMFPQPHC